MLELVTVLKQIYSRRQSQITPFVNLVFDLKCSTICDITFSIYGQKYSIIAISRQ